jgi:hypothetical protein
MKHATFLAAIAIAIAINQSAATGQTQLATRLPPGLCPAGGCTALQTTPPARPPWTDQTAAAAAAAAPNSICQVTVTIGTTRSTTSGVYLTPQLILTVAHVFADGPGPITISSPAGDVQIGILKRLNSQIDLAAIGVSSKHPTPRKLARQPPTRHTTIYAAGCGRTGRLRVWTGRVLGWVSRRLTASADTMVITGQAGSGDSGGPIIDAAGDVVGIIWGTRDGNTYAVDLDTITAFLTPTGAASAIAAPAAGDPTPAIQLELAELRSAIFALRTQLAEVQTRGAPISGPPGPQGPGGPAGPPGLPGEKPIDSGRPLTPITVRIQTANGKIIKTAAVRPGDTITLSLVPVTP